MGSSPTKSRAWRTKANLSSQLGILLFLGFFNSICQRELDLHEEFINPYEVS